MELKVIANSQDGGDYKLRLVLDDVAKQIPTEKVQMTGKDIERSENVGDQRNTEKD